jgi:hypothetical protein
MEELLKIVSKLGYDCPHTCHGYPYVLYKLWGEVVRGISRYIRKPGTEIAYPLQRFSRIKYPYD